MVYFRLVEFEYALMYSSATSLLNPYVVIGVALSSSLIGIEIGSPYISDDDAKIIFGILLMTFPLQEKNL